MFPRPCSVLAALVVTLLADAHAEAYELDFHYYAVYAVLRAKGYSPAEANRLAGFSQFIDDNGRTEPLYCSAETRARFHFAGSAKDMPTVANFVNARTAVANSFLPYTAANNASQYVAGAALHLIADTFSHATFTAWRNRTINCREGSWRPCIGHADTAEDGHAPDRPYNAPSNALAAAESVYNAVPISYGATPLPWSTLAARGGNADFTRGLVAVHDDDSARTVALERSVAGDGTSTRL